MTGGFPGPSLRYSPGYHMPGFQPEDRRHGPKVAALLAWVCTRDSGPVYRETGIQREGR
jgi:hypothetical protein